MATRATIKEGSTGSDVVAWQNILHLTTDGKFTSAVKTATEAFQQKYGLKVDGVVGPATWAKGIEVTSSLFQRTLTKISDAGMSLPKKVPPWGWAAVIGATLTGIAYAILGKTRPSEVQSERNPS